MGESAEVAREKLVKFFKQEAKKDRDESTTRRAVINSKYYAALGKVQHLMNEKVSGWNPRVLKSFDITSEAGVDIFKKLYEDRDERFRKICSILIEVIVDGVAMEVPVTPPKPSKVNDETYHTICITCAGGRVVEILIREYDNYIVGFRVYNSPEERAAAYWCIFCNEDISANLGKTQKAQYGSAHTDAEAVELGIGMLDTICEYLAVLYNDPDMKTSEHGFKCIGALFVLFGEAQRFAVIRDWVLRAVESLVLLSPTRVMYTLMQDWSSLSKCAFMGFLVSLEAPLYEAYELVHSQETDYINPYTNHSKLHQHLDKKQRKHPELIRFRYIGDKFDMSSLVGKELLLLNHCDEDCSFWQMRDRGYKLPLPLI